MSRSTFSGPVQVGVDDAPFSESTVAKIGPNWGFLKMAQSAPITQDTTTRFPTSDDVTAAPTMIIPASSTLVRISVLITTAWGSGHMDIGMGWGNPVVGFDRNNLVDNMSMTTAGLVVAGPGDTDDLSGVPDDVTNWMNIGYKNHGGESEYKDRFILVDSSNTGSGAGILTVEYCQAVNLEPIA